MSDQSYYPSFEVQLTQAYTETKDKLVVPRAYNCYVGVMAASLPVTWYNVPAGRNTLIFSYGFAGFSTSDSQTFTFIVPPGNYTASELATIIHWSGDLWELGYSSPFSFGCVFQENTLKFQFIFPAQNDVSFFSLQTGPLALAMGFTQPSQFEMNSGSLPYVPPPGSQYGSLGDGFNRFVDSTYRVTSTSDQCADLSGPRNIHIKTNFKVRQLTSGTITLAVVPVDTTFSSILNYSGSFSAQMYDNIIGDINLSFSDDQGNEIDFHGVPWSVLLRFDFKSPDAVPRYADAVDPFLDNNPTSLYGIGNGRAADVPIQLLPSERS